MGLLNRCLGCSLKGVRAESHCVVIVEVNIKHHLVLEHLFVDICLLSEVSASQAILNIKSVRRLDRTCILAHATLSEEIVLRVLYRPQVILFYVS